jgi:hypothetical protein
LGDGLQPLSMVKPGLAQVDSNTGTVNKTLNMKKLLKLSENYHELMNSKVLPFGVNSTMIVSPLDNSLETIIVNNQYPPDTAVDILTINRIIMCDYMMGNVLTSVISRQPSGPQDSYWPVVCPHCNLTDNLQHPREEFVSTKPGWECRPFIVTQNDINSTDIYILTDPPQIQDQSAYWILDSTQNLTDNRQKFGSSPSRLNEKLSELLGENDNATIWVHVLSSENPDEAFDVYIGGFAKGTPAEKIKIHYLTPQPCYFFFQVWI